MRACGSGTIPIKEGLSSMKERHAMISSRQKLKRQLRQCWNSALRNMLSEIGKKECYGHDRMRLLDATCVIGLPDGTSVKVRARTKTLASLTSGTQQLTTDFSLPTRSEAEEQTTDRRSDELPRTAHLSREELDN